MKKTKNDFTAIETHDDDCWYLDNDGNRLEDQKLFKKSPWTIIENGKARKVVKRFSNENGEIWFAMEPWFRIGDYY
jgi:hypothetical protein